MNSGFYGLNSMKLLLYRHDECHLLLVTADNGPDIGLQGRLSLGAIKLRRGQFYGGILLKV